jgi:branched-subunit amino acid aminotransferase/4-amino-4-deoxychorismate lyase
MRAEKGEVRLLDRHLDRLQNSAARFGFRIDLDAIRAAIEETALLQESPLALRLMLAPNGSWTLETRLIPAQSPQFLRLSTVRVSAEDHRLYHKTTDRQVYESARASLEQNTDVVLINELGQITETTIANVAVLRDGAWITPPVSCGLLAGVMRAELLDNDAIVEGVIASESLVAGETVRCFNALRGVFESTLQL